VTAELDAGPIIEQDVIHVDHTDSPAVMIRRGRDIERSVLLNGLVAHLQDRVFRDGLRTVVFR
jgi:formyltetrahydrofolate deformylase